MILKLLLFFVLLGFCFAQDKGKKAFDNKDYDKAYQYYQNILERRKNDSSAKFGAGVSAYKRMDFDNAKDYFNEVKNNKDKILSSKAYYNLANIYRDENKIEESLDYLKKAIELNPQDQDAKINFELLKKMVNEKDKSQKNDQGSNSDKEDKQKDDQGSNSGKEDKQKDDQGSNSDKEDKQKDDQGSNSDKEDKQKDDKKNNLGKQSVNQEENKRMTDREMQAEAILNALKDQEKINQKQKILKSKSKILEKDW